jgi:hypothetical protein
MDSPRAEHWEKCLDGETDPLSAKRLETSLLRLEKSFDCQKDALRLGLE